jgi:uncharacterized protein
MHIEENSAPDCASILKRSHIGRLGCCRDNQPYVVPIYFVYEPDHLYGFSTGGQKIEWMRANPKVCVEVDEIANHFQWETVVITGRYRELLDLAHHAEEREHARRLLERHSQWWGPAFAARRLKSESDFIPGSFYCIEIASMTGYRAVADGEEYASTSAARLSSRIN